MRKWNGNDHVVTIAAIVSSLSLGYQKDQQTYMSHFLDVNDYLAIDRISWKLIDDAASAKYFLKQTD